MRISNKGIELIKKHEGLRLSAYQCSAGVWTIGYGHTGNVTPDMTITLAEAEELLRKDLLTAETAVNAAYLAVNQNQFDALVSFVFNIGKGAFGKSTLLKKAVVNPDDPSIRDEFMKWVNGGGQRLPGLVKRRNDEANLYFTL